MKRDALLSSDRQGDLNDEGEQLRLDGQRGKNTQVGDGDEHLTIVTAEVITQVREFLHQPVRVFLSSLALRSFKMKVRERLQRVLHYMREKYYFCFWCGAEYKNKEDLEISCPGITEEDHD